MPPDPVVGALRCAGAQPDYFKSGGYGPAVAMARALARTRDRPRLRAKAMVSRGGSRNMKRVVLLHAEIFCHTHIYLTTPT